MERKMIEIPIVEIAYNISFHKEHFMNARGFMEYRKKHMKITQIIWVRKQLFVCEYGLTESSAPILITLN